MKTTKIWSKILSMAVAVAMVMSLLPQFVLPTKAAGSLTLDGTTCQFTVNADNTITITKFIQPVPANPVTDIIIPAQINGYTISSIGASAFSGQQLTSVTFDPASQIKTIGDSAFASNPLGSGVMNMPSTLTSLGVSAFASCSALTSIDMSGLSNLTGINASTFSMCGKLSSAILPPNLTTIAPSAFYITGLTYIKIPASVSTILGAGNVFYGLPANSVIDLTDFPAGSIAGTPWGAVNAIVRWAPADSDPAYYPFVFNPATGMICGIQEGYTGPWNITIPATIDGIPVQGLADGTFGSRPANTNITSIAFDPNLNITKIPDYTFQACSKLTSVTLPDTVTSIGVDAFWTNIALKTITLPSGLQSIGAYAFYNTGLTSITIPDGTTLGVSVFTCDTSLTSVTFLGTPQPIPTSAFNSQDTNLVDINLPDMPMNSVVGAPWNAPYANINWADGTTPAQIVTDDTGLWQFNTTNGTIVKYLGTVDSSTDLVVPSTLNYQGIAYPITTVGDANTSGIIPAPKQLNSVTFSDGIKTLNAYSFSNVKIKTANLGTTLTTVGYESLTNSGLTSMPELPASLTTISYIAFQGENFPAGTIVNIPSSATGVDVTAFANNPSITQINVAQNRLATSTGNGYPLSPATVQGNAPFGAPNGIPVYFADDPQPVVGNGTNGGNATTVVANPDGSNTALVTLYVKMNNNTTFTAIAGDPNNAGNPVVTASISPDGNQWSKVTMVVPANDTYNLDITFGPTGYTQQFTTPVDVNVFHTVTYDLNGGTGTVPAGGSYVPGYSFAVANQGSLANSGYTFQGWNTAQDGTGTAYAEGANASISADTVLYAQWELIPPSPTPSPTLEPTATPSPTLIPLMSIEYMNGNIKVGDTLDSTNIQVKDGNGNIVDPANYDLYYYEGTQLVGAGSYTILSSDVGKVITIVAIAKTGTNYTGTVRSDISGTVIPKDSPVPSPTLEPSATPSPTETPTASPTETPTITPSPSPTETPTMTPSPSPTETPSPSPTLDPTASPSPSPTLDPSPSPTDEPTATPSPTPTLIPLDSVVYTGTTPLYLNSVLDPSMATVTDINGNPVDLTDCDIFFTSNGTIKPTNVILAEDIYHQIGIMAVAQDGTVYVGTVSADISIALDEYDHDTLWSPSPSPTLEPTESPTMEPSPTLEPTVEPTASPTEEPTATPTLAPTLEPSATPTMLPTFPPTPTSTLEPSATPSASPTMEPTAVPTDEPTLEPTPEATVEPSETPTVTLEPTATDEPTGVPQSTLEPTAVPTDEPTLVPSITPIAEPTATPLVVFTDEHIWYLRGYPDGTIQPEGTITRAEAAMALYRLVSDSTKANLTNYGTFKDVPLNAWYGDAIGKMAGLGIIQGRDDGMFYPSDPITRAELAAMLSRIYALDTSGTMPFSDVTPDYWFYNYVLSASNKGWIDGYNDGTFRPEGKATRAEFATMVNRVLDRQVDYRGLSSTVDAQITQFSDLSPSYWGYDAMIEASNTHDYTTRDANGNEIWTDITGNGLDVVFNK